MGKVAIVILNWNQPQLTIDCLRSINCSKTDGKIKVEIVLVDNASQKKNREMLNSWLEASKNKLKVVIKLIENKANLGFTGGNNVGIRYALRHKADYVFLLNNDTVIKSDCILNLWKTFKNKEAGIAVPKIYYAPGFEFHKKRYQPKEKGKVVWYAGGKIDWNNILGKHIGVDEVDRGQFNKVKQVDFATGCAMMVKKEVFRRVGLFDERFFLYLEDLDFSYRVQKAGFKILFNPQAVVWHKNAGSSSSGSALQRYYITRNRLLFGRKYASVKMKLLLLKQALSNLRKGSEVEKRAIKDYFWGRFGGRY